jgi:thiol-disulfide isomerase/thioredoxin
MKLKKLMTSFLCIAVLCGCAQGKDKKDEDSAQETAAPVQVNLSKDYRKLPEENHFDVIEKDTLISVLNHGTAALFLGFPECPWCQEYIPLLEQVLAENDAVCDYYNIYEYKKSDREFYDSVAALIESQNDTGEEIVQYDNDGKQVIYMPLVLFIEEGRIIGFDNETCTEDSSKVSPEHYWTKDKKAALKEKLTQYVARISAKQAENDSKGCDTGCKVGD